MGCPEIGILSKNLVFTIQALNAAGAPVDADGNVSYSVYEDETATAILTGTMAKLAGQTGFYSEQISMTAANGFETYKTYTIRITATVETISVAKSYTFTVIGTSAAVSGSTGTVLVAGDISKADILTRVKQITGRTDLTDIDTEIFAALKELAQRTLSIKTSTTGTTTVSQSYIGKPSDIIINGIDGLIINTVPYDPISWDEYLEERTEGYILRGDNVYFRPTPSSAYAYTLYYARKAVVDDVDSIPFGTEFEEAINYLTAAKVYENYEIWDGVQTARSLYEQELDKVEPVHFGVTKMRTNRR